MVITLNVKKRKKVFLSGRLTRARSLFKVRYTSWFLIPLRLAILAGSNRACSTVLATYPAFPFWKSLMEVSLGRGAPSKSRERVQTGTSTWQLSLLLMIAPSLEDLVWATLAFLLILCCSGLLGLSNPLFHHLFSLLISFLLFVSWVSLRNLGRGKGWRFGLGCLISLGLQQVV